ncbi:MAG: hypothetical protein WC765_00005 [Phycisphaerae bacterium]
MKSKITKFAVAAVILITVLLGIKFTGTPDMANVAWADVIASIDKVKAVAYEQTIETRQGKSNSKCFVTEDGVMRTEIGTDFIMIFDFNEGITLTLDSYKDKKAFINHLIGGKKGRGLHKYINWLKNLSEEGGKYIGNEIIDGKEVSVFVHEIPYEKTTVWVNTKTLLPVRVEQLNLPNTDANIIMPTMFLSSSDFGDPNGNYSRGGSICSGRGSGKGINDETKKIMTNFNWNMEIDNSLFNTVPPADYIVEEKSINDSEVSEKDLIAALKFWTEMSDGFFPDNINDLGDPNKVKPMLIMKYKKGGDHKQEFEQAYDMMHIILKGVYFAQEKKADGNWEYTGGGAKFGDANMIICKWKLENSNSYRVLYGDLSIYDTNDMPQ